MLRKKARPLLNAQRRGTAKIAVGELDEAEKTLLQTMVNKLAAGTNKLPEDMQVLADDFLFLNFAHHVAQFGHDEFFQCQTHRVG